MQVNWKIIGVIVLVVVLCYYFFNKKENFTNQQQTFANSLVRFFNTNNYDVSYTDYLNFLINNDNTSHNLIFKDTYNKIKSQKNYLTSDFILALI